MVATPSRGSFFPCLFLSTPTPHSTQVLPQLVDPGSGNFRPAAGGALLSSPAVQSTHVASIAPFSWVDAPGTEPPGTLDNQWAVARDFRGVSRGSNAPPGAFAS